MTNIDKLVKRGIAFNLGYVPEEIRTKDCKKAWNVCAADRGFGSGVTYFGDTAEEACGAMIKACAAYAKESLAKIQKEYKETMSRLQATLDGYAEMEK